MSIHAISWALSQDMARSSEKFILVCLANYADESGICYPSIARLCRDTSQDRKTVINNLKSLCESGLLRDTQRRIGPTAGVPVYQITGLPEASKHHYVYKLTQPETGEYYIGKRSCQGDPESDTYRGSGKWPREMAAAGVLLIREIISEHETSTEALAEEMRLMRSLQDDPLLRNLETPKNRKQYQKRNSSDFPAEVSQNSREGVPFFRGSSTENGTQNHHITTKEPSTEPSYKATGLTVSALQADGLEADLANELLAHRKRKKATLTQRAWDAIKREAGKAGWPLQAAVEKLIERDWKGFEADWVAPRSRGANGKQAEWDTVMAQFVGQRGNPDDPYTIDMEV